MLGAITARRARLTYALLAALVLMFGATVAGAPGYDWISGKGVLPPLLALYGLIPSAVASGEVWRLVTAGFLHASLIHLVGNCAFLFLYGSIAERRFGVLRFAAIYVVALVAGNLVAAFTSGPQTVTVGASGAVLGVIAAVIVAMARAGRGSDPHPVASAVVPVLLLSLYSFRFNASGVSIGAHIGGALAGLLLAWVMEIRSTRATVADTTAGSIREGPLVKHATSSRPRWADEVINDPANRRVLRARPKWIALLLTLGATAALWAWALVPGSGTLAAGSLLAALAVVLVATAVHYAYLSLKLTPLGFSWRGLIGANTTVEWRDVKRFEVRYDIAGTTIAQAIFRYEPAYLAAQQQNENDGPPQVSIGSLPFAFGDRSLAILLEEWRRKWSNPARLGRDESTPTVTERPARRFRATSVWVLSAAVVGLTLFLFVSTSSTGAPDLNCIGRSPAVPPVPQQDGTRFFASQGSSFTAPFAAAAPWTITWVLGGDSNRLILYDATAQVPGFVPFGGNYDRNKAGLLKDIVLTSADPTRGAVTVKQTGRFCLTVESYTNTRDRYLPADWSVVVTQR